MKLKEQTKTCQDVIFDIEMMSGIKLTKTFEAHLDYSYGANSGYDWRFVHSEYQLFEADDGLFYPFSQIKVAKRTTRDVTFTYTVKNLGSLWFETIYTLIKKEYMP